MDCKMRQGRRGTAMDREITKLCKLANLELYLELNVRLFLCFSIHIDVII